MHVKKGQLHGWHSLLKTIEGTSEICSIAYSPDGTHIAAGSRDSTIRVWDAETNELVGAITGQEGFGKAIAYSPSGKHIISGCGNGTVTIWDVESNEVVGPPPEIRHTDAICDVTFSLDGKRIALGSKDCTALVQDLETGKTLWGLEGPKGADVKCLKYSPDGHRLIIGCLDATIRILDAETGEAVVELPQKANTGCVNSVAYSRDGKRFASVSATGGLIQIWDAKSGRRATDLGQRHEGSISSVTYSPDRKHLASGGNDGIICVSNIEDGGKTGEFIGHASAVECVAYSPDGTRIASGSTDHTVRIWDTGLIKNSVKSASNRFAIFNFPAYFKLLNEQNFFSDIGFGHDSRLDGGWIRTPSSQPLLWVPPWHRQGLVWPNNAAVTANSLTELDFSDFLHGSDWQKCGDRRS